MPPRQTQPIDNLRTTLWERHDAYSCDSSVKFEHVIDEDATRMMAGHPVAKLNAKLVNTKRMTRDVKGTCGCGQKRTKNQNRGSRRGMRLS